MKRPYVIIIGAMKSGTTTLFDVLARHPAICATPHKEPAFFAFDDMWSKGFDWFDTLFDPFDPDRHAYRLEASTDYTKAPFVTGVWERMTANPDVEVKLLYIMRDPLKRIESHARHVQLKRKELGRLTSPRPDHSLDAGLSPVNLAVSQYATQLAAYQTAWETGRLHCLTLEELWENPAETLARVYGFLGLDFDDTATTLPVSNSAAERIRPTQTWRRLTAVKPLMAAGRTLLPGGVRDKIKGGFRRQVEVEGRFKLTEEETETLRALYAPEIAKLREVYGPFGATPWLLP